jgi:hypothetical protein
VSGETLRLFVFQTCAYFAGIEIFTQFSGSKLNNAGCLSYYTDMNALITHLLSPAYIDGGSGSMLLQMVLAGVFASLYALKGFWFRLKSGVVLSRAVKKSNTD